VLSLRPQRTLEGKGGAGTYVPGARSCRGRSRRSR
jgi:hypothetical protein